MELVLILLPLAGALGAVAWGDERRRPLLLPVTGIVHLVATLFFLATRTAHVPGASLQLDALGGLTLAVVSTLFTLVALYAPGYLAERSDEPNRLFCLCLLLFLSMASVVALAQDLGLLWVAMEATTLATAPLLYFNRNARSLEATWKYLVIGSVGIALALLGSFFLAYSGQLGGTSEGLSFDPAVIVTTKFSKPWLHAAFVLLLVGYGTKLGLAPMHTWKPDAYGESPGIVGALLAGGVTSCAFLALLRGYTIVNLAGEGVFARQLLVVMGLVSMAVATVFVIRQTDLKRLLAYSSIEHMGILTLGIGLGGAATTPALLHLVNNALVKASLFLAVGNLHRAYESKSTDVVRGALRHFPVSAGVLLAGFLAIVGTPPFGPFLSEFGILQGAFAGGHFVAGGLYLGLLGAVFLGLSSTVLTAVQGRGEPPPPVTAYRDSPAMTAPLLLGLGLVLLLGVWLPPPLLRLLEAAATPLREVPLP